MSAAANWGAIQIDLEVGPTGMIERYTTAREAARSAAPLQRAWVEVPEIEWQRPAPPVDHPKRQTITYDTGYLAGCFDGARLARVICDTAAMARCFRSRFDAIVFRGVSGSLVAPGVAAALGCPLAVVRKGREGSHSYRTVEGARITDGRYLAIDDFIETGATLQAINSALHHWCRGTVTDVILFRALRNKEDRQRYIELGSRGRRVMVRSLRRRAEAEAGDYSELPF